MVKIITFTGVSGTGKTTIVKDLLKQSEFKLVTSYTTRESRESDLPGEYVYLSIEEFMQLKEKGCYLWAVEYAGNWYGTLREDIDNALNLNTYSMLILVPEVVEILHSYVGNLMIPFHVENLSQEVLRERLQKRGDNESIISKRLLALQTWSREVNDSKIPFINISNDNELSYAVNFVKSHLQKVLNKD